MKQKIDVDKIVDDCKKLGEKYVKQWRPTNSSWKTIEGAAYIRLSTEEQVKVDKGSLEQQVHLAVLEAETRSKQRQLNYRITKFYIEPGISGRKTDRKELRALMRGISVQRYKFIAFKEISRLTRDSAFWKEFFKLCHVKKCEIVIRGLPIDPNDPAQILQLDILAAFAEYEAAVTAKRIRESVFSSMKNNGKFNSTHRRLGLGPLIVDGHQRPGFYQVIENEVPTVLYIFRTFIRYGSHNKTLEVLAEKGIKNWNGQPFKRHSLSIILSDPRYIAKWYLNPDNKGKDQEELSENKRFYEIELPHDPIVPLELWNQVQHTVKNVAGNLGKTTRVERVFTLSGGILKYHDGSTFRGSSGTGKTQKSHYYFNGKNRVRIRCDLIEKDVASAVTKLIQNAPEVQKGIAAAGAVVRDNIQLLENQLVELNRELKLVQQSKSDYLKKMDVLVRSSTDLAEVDLFKNAFKDFLKENDVNQNRIETQITQAEKGIYTLKKTNFSWADVGKHSMRVQEVMAENDPVALKRAYYALFDSIVIGPEDEKGVRPISYILKNWDGSIEDINRLR